MVAFLRGGRKLCKLNTLNTLFVDSASQLLRLWFNTRSHWSLTPAGFDSAEDSGDSVSPAGSDHNHQDHSWVMAKQKVSGHQASPWLFLVRGPSFSMAPPPLWPLLLRGSSSSVACHPVSDPDLVASPAAAERVETRLLLLQILKAAVDEDSCPSLMSCGRVVLQKPAAVYGTRLSWLANDTPNRKLRVFKQSSLNTTTTWLCDFQLQWHLRLWRHWGENGYLTAWSGGRQPGGIIQILHRVYWAETSSSVLLRCPAVLSLFILHQRS